MKKLLVTVTTALALVGSALGYSAAPVDPSDYSGIRKPGLGITGSAPWNTPGNLSLSWNISQSGPTFHYVYNLSANRNPSHILFELSDTITPQNINQIITNVQLNGGGISTPTPQLFSPSDPGNSNPNLPGNLYGFKIDFPTGQNSWTISFDSIRAPMWGDFYSKDGKFQGNFVYAYNTGFGVDPTTQLLSYIPWIPVPDTKTVPIPEPGTYLTLLTLLAGVVLMTLRRQPVPIRVDRRSRNRDDM